MQNQSDITEPLTPGKCPTRRWVIGLVLLMGVLLFGGELIARYAFGLGDPPLFDTHPTIEYMLRPDQDVRRFGNRVWVNAYGMRSDPFPPNKSSVRELRVLVIGDSIVNGGNRVDHPDLATTLAQVSLANELDRPVVVGNISAGSWGPGNQLAYLETFGHFDADMAVIVLSAQDVEDVPTFDELNPVIWPSQKPYSGLVEGVRRYVLPQLSTDGDRPAEGSQSVSPSDANQRQSKRRAAVIADLQQMIGRLEADAIPTVVVRWWYPGNERQGFGPGDQAAADVLVDAAKSSGATLIDLRPTLKVAAADGQSLYRDGLHPSILGQHRIANAIVEAVKTQLQQPVATNSKDEP